MKKAIMLSLLWLGILGAFIFYGYFICGDADIQSQACLGPRFSLECRTENAVLWGGFGVGLATCTTIGFLIVGLVRTKHLGKALAMLLLLVSALCSTILTPVSINVASVSVSVEILHGESGMLVLFQTGLMLFWAALTFVVFTIWVLLSKGTRDETVA